MCAIGSELAFEAFHSDGRIGRSLLGIPRNYFPQAALLEQAIYAISIALL